MINFKSLTGRVFFLISLMVIVIGIGVAAYMQSRIIEEITEVSRLTMIREVSGLSAESNLYFITSSTAVPSNEILSAIGNARFYDTGFAALVSTSGEFFATSAEVSSLSSASQSAIISAAATAVDGFAEFTLDGVRYVMAVEVLVNDYTLFALAPNSEFTYEITASLLRFVVIFAFAFGLILLINYFVGKTFAKPFIALNKIIGKFSQSGSITLNADDSAAVTKYGPRRDEIGQSFNYVVELFKRLESIGGEVTALAHGDLTVEITILSEKDVLGNSLHLLNEKLNDTLKEIEISAEQVSSGSKQIADGSQTLAQGSTEQAASVQQLSASISAVAQTTKENAGMAERAAMLANEIKVSAEKGSGQMNEMMTAVKDINESSQNISKVIKSIDDIAFQTNILALNAAVEAARAGQHGKGFAVVAEEVRNLAAKSAVAAKDTESLIADSIAKAELGSKIAGETSESLSEIVAGIGESNQIVIEIAKSSEQQTDSISQINTGIDQVAKVTQQNSATAEQSAASSAEMSNQSSTLEQLISQFKLKNTSKIDRLPPHSEF
ncbi:MAG: methyl-accepting chemotaxis protein [Oscillospiraceae bacterium]|nr:methyl-accepting chemotaxis protein [Oscillospiraceae bacterium]